MSENLEDKRKHEERTEARKEKLTKEWDGIERRKGFIRHRGKRRDTRQKMNWGKDTTLDRRKIEEKDWD